MQVRRLEFADAPLELIDNLAGSNFFSSSSFAKIWKTIGGKAVYWTVEDESNTVAILPGVEFGRGFFKRFQSMPDGCYSSVLFNQSQDNSEIVSMLTTAIAKAGYLKVFLNDFHNSYAAMNDYNSETSSTYLVNISSREWEPLDSKLRQQIHKADRSELHLQKFDSNRNLTGFMDLVAKHESRRNVKVKYNRSFFESLAIISETDDRVKWVWCEHDGKPVASHIFILEGESLLHWQMYYDEKYSELQAAKYIPYIIAKEASEKGVRTLNLGSTPSGAEGAEYYKKKWGGEEYIYNCYTRKSFLGQFL